MLPHLIHIVRRFGQVGGMENYVWHLVHGISARGYSVSVICEEVFGAIDSNIDIYKVLKAPEKPRWKSMLAFRARVDSCVSEQFKGRSVIIHSHERSLCHHVTTFHGPPIEPPRGLECLSRLNKRVRAWQRMERDELLSSKVQSILPVSSQIRDSLVCRYPETDLRQHEIAWPGVTAPTADEMRKQRFKRSGDAKFAFIGREWKRKGLDIAVRIVENFRKRFPKSTLTVYGMNSEELPRAMRQKDWIITKGWVSSVVWSGIDVLLHPARNEPFGMVIPEARSHGVPVVMSSSVGASDFGFSETKVLGVNASITEWCVAVENVLDQASGTSEVKWTWDDLVNQHVETIYPNLGMFTL